ncbi:MAG TPA: cytochrome c3 family protein [Bacillales bacterium]|nr:cytochrome c3 family protein [Bacillales bacterium]
MKRLLLGLLLISVLLFIFVNGQIFAAKKITPTPTKTSTNNVYTNIQNLNSTASSQQTHNSYSNNTNACASCHQTHNSNADSLLMKEGIYNTCVSCHDGTMGVYNIFSSSTAGTFQGTTGGNSSIHASTGSLSIKAAPGGIIGAHLSDDEIKAKGGSWTEQFNCASCHSPHGSYSDRLLNYNPNDMGNTNIKNGGNKAVLIPVLTFSQTILSKKYTDSKETKGYPFILIRGTKANLGISDSKINASDTVIALFQWDKNKYIRSENPWLYGVTYGTNRSNWTQLYKTQAPDYTLGSDGEYKNIINYSDNDVHFQFDKGYVYSGGTQLHQAVRGDIAQAYVVKLDKVKISNYGNISVYAINQSALHQGPVDPKGTAINDPAIKKITSDGKQVAVGLGKAMSKFCSACHSDYLAHSGEKMGFFNTDVYRHSTDQDQFNCVRCHYAHGTDVTVMHDAKGYTIKDLMSVNKWSEAEARKYLLDSNPSSALKRFTDMSVCYACHGNLATQQIYNNPDIEFSRNMPDLVPYSEKKTY